MYSTCLALRYEWKHTGTKDIEKGRLRAQSVSHAHIHGNFKVLLKMKKLVNRKKRLSGTHRQSQEKGGFYLVEHIYRLKQLVVSTLGTRWR